MMIGQIPTLTKMKTILSFRLYSDIALHSLENDSLLRKDCIIR